MHCKNHVRPNLICIKGLRSLRPEKTFRVPLRLCLAQPVVSVRVLQTLVRAFLTLVAKFKNEQCCLHGLAVTHIPQAVFYALVGRCNARDDLKVWLVS